MCKKISIRLFGPLREKAKKDEIEICISPPVTGEKVLSEIQKMLDLTPQEKRNLRIADENYFLDLKKEITSEKLLIIPPVGGG